MKKFFAILSVLPTFTVVAIICGALFNTIDETTGNSSMPAWCILPIFCIPFFVARIIWKGDVKKAFKFGSEPITLRYSSEPFKIPAFQNSRNSLAADLALSVEAAGSIANKSTSVTEFLNWYDLMIARAEKLSKLDGKVTNINGSLAIKYINLQDNFQKCLRDAIDRSGDAIIDLKKGRLKYEDAIIREKLLAYKSELDVAAPRFNDLTKEHARIKFRYVCHECKMVGLLDASGSDWNEEAKMDLSSVNIELQKVDAMEGHAFEYWCADLLKKSGFENVNVTQGSGDQGVDVLAEKGGIKYAIQCKCYSSDLGNTPVQEVNAGKTIYRCHIGAVMTNRYFTESARQAAEATGTLLWDRNSIIKMLKEINI